MCGSEESLPSPGDVDHFICRLLTGHLAIGTVFAWAVRVLQAQSLT